MPDIWNGKTLPARGRAFTDIHYRLYDRCTGRLLGFRSTSALTSIVDDAVRLQRENPNAQIYAVEYDGPAYPN